MQKDLKFLFTMTHVMVGVERCSKIYTRKKKNFRNNTGNICAVSKQKLQSGTFKINIHIELEDKCKGPDIGRDRL